VNHIIDAIHPSVVFEKVDDGIPNIEKNKTNNWVKKYASTNQDSKLVSFHFILEL
jgi:hypothetical protein